MDAAPNYGNTGSTIGHELTHGFDDEGRQFDAQGNLRDWWTPKDDKEFRQRAACVADQYAQYTVVDDIKINSQLTLGEDVADLGGTILAYLAWQEETKSQKLADGGRPDARAALLRRLRPVGLRRRAPRDPAPLRQGQPPLAARVPHQRRGGEHAAVRRGLRLQAGPADGQGAGQGLPDLVGRIPAPR